MDTSWGFSSSVTDPGDAGVRRVGDLVDRVGRGGEGTHQMIHKGVPFLGRRVVVFVIFHPASGGDGK